MSEPWYDIFRPRDWKPGNKSRVSVHAGPNISAAAAAGPGPDSPERAGQIAAINTNLQAAVLPGNCYFTADSAHRETAGTSVISLGYPGPTWWRCSSAGPAVPDWPPAAAGQSYHQNTILLHNRPAATDVGAGPSKKQKRKLEFEMKIGVDSQHSKTSLLGNYMKSQRCVQCHHSLPVLRRSYCAKGCCYRTTVQCSSQRPTT